MTDKNIQFLKEKWKDNKEYLNLPGLQYLWYANIKPAIYDNVYSIKKRIDDMNWYISYDSSLGEVYISLTEDNSTFYFDQDETCGNIQDGGMLQVMVKSNMSNIVSGFIDDHKGEIGDNSDIIGDATGKLYVNFDRGYDALYYVDQPETTKSYTITTIQPTPQNIGGLSGISEIQAPNGKTQTINTTYLDSPALIYLIYPLSYEKIENDLLVSPVIRNAYGFQIGVEPNNLYPIIEYRGTQYRIMNVYVGKEIYTIKFN